MAKVEYEIEAKWDNFCECDKHVAGLYVVKGSDGSKTTELCYDCAEEKLEELRKNG